MNKYSTMNAFGPPSTSTNSTDCKSSADFVASKSEIASNSTTTTKRLCCLLPSITDICVALGLADSIVGITHECDIQSVLKSKSQEKAEEHADTRSSSIIPPVYIVTKSGLDASTLLDQGKIDDVVKAQSAGDPASISSISPLYPILQEEFVKANPSIVFTQTLCNVCAPTPSHVQSIMSSCVGKSPIQVHSFHPTTLMDVVDTFVTVAELCGVPERGNRLKLEFMEKLFMIQRLCDEQQQASAGIMEPQKKMRVLLLEWLDPPYDGGHWIHDMIEWVGCETIVIGGNAKGVKSKQITWDDVYQADPDVVIVACCGFDLERNVRDTWSYGEKLKSLRAAKNNRIIACNGDLHFARPGPGLLHGILVIAQAVYGKDIFSLELMNWFIGQSSLQWQQVDVCKKEECNHACDHIDIEDMSIPYEHLHREACNAGQMTYTDPETKYQVFTELAHKARGRCCGSGCRHCPFDHINVKDKAKRIQQPAFLYEGSESDTYPLLSLNAAIEGDIKVLFFSGGKDSFLALRALINSYKVGGCKEKKLCIILLTTFDAESRVIAHQDLSIDVIIQQAKHLCLPLIGIPMHRKSAERYVDRVALGLNLVVRKTGLERIYQITSLAFGDLHLEHIKQWRETEFLKFGVCLEYPLWKMPYKYLLLDLKKSSVEVVLSATTKEYVEVDEVFNEDMSRRVEIHGGDAFGENGEFHTVAKVWKVSRDKALSL